MFLNDTIFFGILYDFKDTQITALKNILIEDLKKKTKDDLNKSG